MDDSQNAASDDKDLPQMLRASRCLHCEQHRIVRSGKGSVFMMCELGLKDPYWPKYPPQPVSSCPHYRECETPSTIEPS